MPSPFPGMDPYLEQPTLWPAIHFRLIGAIAAAIEPQLSQDYYVEVETRTYQSQAAEELLIGIADAAVISNTPERSPAPAVPEPPVSTATQTSPQRVTLPMPLPIKERYLEVRAIGTDAVVTVIEMLSPTNKRTGEGRTVYETKRRNVLSSASHLVEIDLLRGGQPMPVLGQVAPAAYQILVSRREHRPAADLYAISLREPLPTIPIPLRAEDGEIVVDLQATLTRVYAEAPYAMRIDYGQVLPAPVLSPAAQARVESIVRENE